jgi:ABC-type amino acid transport substrate-binding protein/ketosteroid isomerase-like protein
VVGKKEDVVPEPLPVIEPDVLTIGVDASAPPPLHSDPNAPNFEGFEVDLTKGSAARLGLSVKYIGALWSESIAALQVGKVDMICTAVTITEARRMIVDFSQPYLDIQLAVVVREGSRIRALKDLDGQPIGVRVATSAQEFLSGHVHRELIRTFDMNAEAYRALAAGEIAAVLDDSPIAQSFAKSVHGLTFAGTISGTEAQYGMVVKKGNTRLRQAVNEVLAEMQADGSYARYYNRSEVTMPTGRDLLMHTYNAFNARDIDAVLAVMHTDVDWPNGWEGGRVCGHQGVRAYWMRQWEAIDPHVEPVGFDTDETGRTVVKVRQVVRDLEGNTISQDIVEHVYLLENGLIKSMEIRQP